MGVYLVMFWLGSLAVMSVGQIRVGAVDIQTDGYSVKMTGPSGTWMISDPASGTDVMYNKKASMRCTNCGQNSPVNVNRGVQSGITGGTFGTPAGADMTGNTFGGPTLTVATPAPSVAVPDSDFSDSNNNKPRNMNSGTQWNNPGAVFG